ncbi:hypothetical protein Apa02nite_032690 [Actinoplanes palleronii]|uniref:Uncharacterized protein n=2 Tax=Actinoplanes palleronii TaxID=113570 RepID=A0ABQ4B927_9ACTN|nr:hypothetical protein Apa02nite_032690 [Actinoplanes palleronii]
MHSMVPLALMATTIGFAPTAQVYDARIYDRDSRLLAEARFDAAGDTFTVTKRSADGGRAYLEFRYVRVDGTVQTGRHQGPATADASVSFGHDFGEGRRLTFRVCVTEEHGFNPCSGTADGENWTVAYA